LFHGPISIGGGLDFNQTAIDEGWAGNGTEGNPFIIEDYIISTDSSCIYIYDTTSYFIIRDCEFTTAGGTDYQYALSFRNAPHGTVNTSTIHNKIGGISLDNCPNFTIMNTNFSAIQLAGLDLYLSGNCRIENNIFINTGVDITGYVASDWQHSIHNNVVNGKPLGYFHSEDSLIIDGNLYGQIILAECTYCNVSNAVISNTTSAIALGHCVNCTVSFSNVSWSRFGILLSKCEEVFILNNTVGPSNECGIHLNDSSLCFVLGNDVFGNVQSGINCIKGMSNAICWNRVFGNGYYGIDCWEGFVMIILGNTVFDNIDGISVNMAPFSQLSLNVVENKTGIGITIGWGSSVCFIFYNHIGWNQGGNAVDDGSSNLWDMGVNNGNFWSDYSGTGVYPIPGSVGSVDNNPFKIDDIPPSITTTTPTATRTTTTTTTSTSPTETNTTTTSGFVPDLTTILLIGGSLLAISILVIVIVINRK
jgi:parallel beta-helix repeat protein